MPRDDFVNPRRHLLAVLGVAALVPHVLFAQRKEAPVVIGLLSRRSQVTDQFLLGPFKESLTKLGWREGQEFVIEARWAEARSDKLKSLADELVAKRPGIIVTIEGVSTRAAAKASRNIPIVQVIGGSPVGYGLAKSLTKPGGMVTGLTNVPGEYAKKYVELLLAAAPAVKRVGFLLDRRSVSFAQHVKNSRAAVAHYGVEARFAELSEPKEIEPAVARFAKEGVEGLVVVPSGLFSTRHVRRRLVELTTAHRWPVIAFSTSFVREGVLMAYRADTDASGSRAAWYVDRILKGTKPGDLPIEQPTKFNLVVNMKVARELGLTIPESIMVRANHVIR